MAKAKDNPFKVNTDTALRFGTGGALAGASLATLVGLAKILTNMKRPQEPDESTENQLVLTLPKRAEAAEEIIDRLAYEKIASAYPRFGPDMEKSANWQTLVASLLAAGGGGMAGYSLIDKLFEMRRMKELNEELEGVKQEYLDKLMAAGAEEKMGMDKTAGLFGDREGERTFSKLDYPIGLAVLTALLGAGGSAWLTKRFLDQSSKDDEAFKPPKPTKIKRVVFKTASAEEIDEDVIPPALGVYLDICSGEPTILGHEKVAHELRKIDMKASDLYKQATESFDRFLLTLKQNPELRKQIRDMSMDTHPVLKYFKWAAGLPFLNDMADQKLYDELSKQYGPRRADNPMAIKYGSDKSASVLDSLLGSLAAERAIDAAVGDKERAQAKGLDKDEELKQLVRSLEIGTADPNAEQFVAKNEAIIRKVLNRLAAEGKI